ncbi:DsrE family protein [Peptococcus simiae]|uniref:DsrE family protein n=1 Tax=Peptococcus simiae TaxID=1643805 RepID=A0ABW9GZB4_9FIRM
MDIIFHVDELDRFGTCLGNVYNTLKYFDAHGLSGQIEIVVNAQAVRGLTTAGAKDQGFAEELQGYMQEGVAVLACQNALTGQDIDPDQLLPGVQVVEAAIIEMAQKQAAGYAYIRP